MLAFVAVTLLTNCSPKTEKANIEASKEEQEGTAQIVPLNDAFPILTESEKELLKKNPDAWLTEVTDSTLAISSQQTFDSLLLSQQVKLLNEKKEDIPFDFNDRWVFTAATNLSAKGCYDPIEGKKSYFVVKEKKYTLTGQDIYEIFDLNPEQKLLNQTPITVGRVDQWNVILIDRNTLWVQHLYAYPNGGQTCLYSEKIYQFVKLNS